MAPFFGHVHLLSRNRRRADDSLIRRDIPRAYNR
jgi:hypothetical protein